MTDATSVCPQQRSYPRIGFSRTIDDWTVWTCPVLVAESIDRCSGRLRTCEENTKDVVVSPYRWASSTNVLQLDHRPAHHAQQPAVVAGDVVGVADLRQGQHLASGTVACPG